jgi:preprotein translocase subunit SecA
MNDQRKAIFEQRIELMKSGDVGEMIIDMRHQVIDDLVAKYIPENQYAEQWNTADLEEEIDRIFGFRLPIVDWGKEEGIADEEVKERIKSAADKKAAEKVAQVGPDLMRQVEKSLLIQTLDQNWREHLVTLDHLRQHVGLRGYAQRDPLNEYKTEAFALFENLLNRLRQDVTRQLMNIRFQMEPPPPLEEQRLPEMHAVDGRG